MTNLLITPLVGRINGIFEWLCPTCSGMTRTWVDNRVPYVQCCMPGCRRTFPIGLVGWQSTPPTLPPFNGVFHDVHVHVSQVSTAKGLTPIVSHYYNRQASELGPTTLPAIVRVAGTVEWRCPAPECSTQNLGYPDWVTGKLACASCSQALWVSGALMGGGKGLRQHPVDWVGLRDQTGRLARQSMRASRNLRLQRKRLAEGQEAHNLCSAR